MTLIISVLTHEAVLQASDRRLVWVASDGSTRVRNDNRNKAVMLGQRMFFAYTGIADIGVNRESTDLWLGRTLGELVRQFHDQADLLEALAARATDRFAHGRLRSVPLARRGHEFAIVGWARFPSSPNLKSYFGLVTNMRAVDGTFLSEPTDGFRVTWFASNPTCPGECSRLVSRLPALTSRRC
ncbi:MAG TPA: hypothetical protein VME22_00085 [Solirubrobacteraceae bacterium]|nr:hypothetical protein [Solirubrobacteraceae bacterium]